MNKKKLPSVIILIILTAITVIFWISFNIYQVFTQEAESVVPNDVMLQIDTKFDTETLGVMKNKIYPE